MPATRRTGRPCTKYQQSERIKKSERVKQPFDFVQLMMEEMSETNYNSDILIPLNERVEMMEEQMRSKSFVLTGPGHSGKSSTIYWALRNCEKNKEVIWIDCAFWQGENSFITELLGQISASLKQYIRKDMVIKGDISFKQLNKQIKRAGVEMTIVLKNPQKLTDHKRPVILYNIFEWMNFSQSASDNLNFIVITRELQFLQTLDKRIKSRMNIPIIFLSRPRADKIKEMIVRRIQHCCRENPGKELLCSKLKKAVQQKQIEKIINHQCQLKSYPISYYLKIMQLILAIAIETEQIWESSSPKEIIHMVEKGFREYWIYIVDHKNIAKTFFSISHMPEITLLGLYRNRFLRQKEGSYTSTITLGELMNDYNHKKSRFKLDGASSFLYSQNVMENALKNLIDWSFLGFTHLNQKLGLINRQIFSRYGPEDIEYLYRQIQDIPAIIRSIYEDQI